MNKIFDKIIVAVGMLLATAAMVIYLCVPAVVTNVPQPLTGFRPFNGLDILYGATVTYGGASYEILNGSATAFLPLLFIIFGVILFGIVSLLDTEKAGKVCRFFALWCFVLAAVFMFYAKDICVTADSDGFITGEALSALFEQSYVLGYGAIISGALSFAAGLLFIVNISLNLYFSKKKSKEKA